MQDMTRTPPSFSGQMTPVYRNWANPSSKIYEGARGIVYISFDPCKPVKFPGFKVTNVGSHLWINRTYGEQWWKRSLTASLKVDSDRADRSIILKIKFKFGSNGHDQMYFWCIESNTSSLLFLFSIFLMLLLLVSSEFSCFDKIQTQPQGGFKFNMKQMVFAYGRYLYRDGLIVQGKGYWSSHE